MNFRDVLEVDGVKAKGFGIIPKLAMLDRELTIEAKAIYSYFCSYAGAGTTAFPGRDKICKDLGISKTRYYKHFNYLKELGYIKVNQKRNDGSKFKHNVYTLVENPIKDKENEDVYKKEKTGENTIKKPCPNFEDTEDKKPCPSFRDTENGDTENKDTISNSSSFKNNNSLYNHQSVSIANNKKTDRQTEDIESTLKNLEERLSIKELKKVYSLDSQIIDEIMLNIFDMYFSDYSIIEGQQKSKELIRSVIMKLTYWHIEALISKYKEISLSRKITNTKAYIQSMIYNIVFEQDLAITNDIKYNFG